MSLLKAIIGQQLSVASARAINTRFLNFYKGDPKPEIIINTNDEKLRELGLSFPKIKYIKDLSNKIITKEINFINIKNKPDEQIIEELTKIKGVGVWTVHMFLMFTLGRTNILPVGDLGIKKAIMLNYSLKKMPTEEKVKQVAEKNNWSPYNSVAAWYLWRSLEMNPESI
ncbi:MAG: DNA-3-methyladenine glycosylase 2 family protein [Bacteroidetes bacterium]|nr:DNA-3-methyladenine glycosylase 2 family protein [Bacteroidota bacterium]